MTDFDQLLKACNTERQREYIMAWRDYGSQRKAAKALGIERGGMSEVIRRIQRYAAIGTYIPATRSRVKHESDKPPLDTSARLQQVSKEIKKRGASRYVVTCAQNATPAFKDGLGSLLKYCEHNKAELIVIPLRYHNPTSRWSEKDESQEWWAQELTPYLLDHRVELCKNLVVMGDIRIQPTAVRPTSEMETFCGGKSIVLGHPKLEQVTIPSPQFALPKLVMTTGAITVDNYTDSKAGKKGEHHHTVGALVIETEGDIFYARQINMEDDGSFYDLDCHYSASKVKTGQKAAGLVLGDLHERFVCKDVVKATFGKGGIVETCLPETIVYHDVMDFYSQNHHHAREVFTKIAKHQNAFANVEQEIDDCAAFIDRHTRKGQKVVFAASNHPDAMARWVKESDWRMDQENAVFYLKTALMMAESVKMTPSGASYDDPFVYWMRRKLKCVKQCLFPGRDESVQVAGIEVGMHGDKGSNGARGGIRQFGRVGVKSVIGHSHSPGVMDGVYQVGTSSRLRLEYNGGPSSWMNTHCLIYPDGKRTLLHIINGKFRAGKNGRR